MPTAQSCAVIAKMPSFCAAVGCSELKTKDSVLSFHQFPSADQEPERLEKWLVNMKRMDPDTKKLWKPKNNSYRLCSKHFSDVCFQPMSALMIKFGRSSKCKQMLKKDAVPTIQVFQHKRTTTSGERRALTKRLRKEVRDKLTISTLCWYKQ